MKFKKIFIAFLFLCFHMMGIAQEVKIPLVSNPALAGSSTSVSHNYLRKTGANFPLIDYFEKDGKTNNSFWLPNSCLKSKGKLIFNVLDSNGVLAAQCDQLTSTTISTLEETQPVFLSFTISAGETYSAGDSFFVEAKNILGEWQTVWLSPNTFFENNEVIIDLPSDQFGTGQFAIRFSSFSANFTNTNTSVFTLSKIVLSAKWPLGLYEHMRTPHLPDSTAAWEYYSNPDVKVLDGYSGSYVWGNCAKLDIKNYLDSVYDNASNLYGGADTLYTHPFDVMNNAVNDTLIFSFAVNSSAINLPGDSLIVEFRNNLGQWIRVLGLGGVSPGYFSSYSFNINQGRLRHANFQSRFILKSTYSKSNQAYWAVSGFRMVRKVQLPFFDDFSTSRISVSQDRWKDNFVYVNNEFPVNHPSINVATFDGLDANGKPYSKFATKGICDILTSHSINLKGLGPSDSLILSFYYQYEPQGTTNQYYPDDSLEIEFRNSAMDKDSFFMIKMISAQDTLFGKFNLFQYVLLNPLFFHDDFQIRIKNRGSLTGNLSQWHVDYLRFNKGRKLFDAIKDMALTNTPPVLLGPYSSMPWYQYLANKANYNHSFDDLRLVNHDNQAYAVDYFRSVIKPEGDTLDKFVNILPTINPQSDSTVTIDKKFDFASAVSADSLVFNTSYRIKISGNQNDNVTGNDTFSVPTIFSNYYAYDDGSAEGGYGIKNKLNVGGSLKYKLEVPDSIVGVYIFFNQSETDVSTQRFNLKVWSKISPLFEPATSDVVIYNQEIPHPLYTSKINGFTSFRFLQAVPVSDSFYVGWDQTSSYVINIGLDKNYRFGLNPNMAYKMDGRWYPTEIPGTVMIRPIMGKFIGAATGLNQALEREINDFILYPNPAGKEVFIDLYESENYHIHLVDIAGKEISGLISNSGKIDLPELGEGLYLMIFENKFNQHKFVKKIIIQP